MTRILTIKIKIKIRESAFKIYWLIPLLYALQNFDRCSLHLHRCLKHSTHCFKAGTAAVLFCHSNNKRPCQCQNRYPQASIAFASRLPKSHIGGVASVLGTLRHGQLLQNLQLHTHHKPAILILNVHFAVIFFRNSIYRGKTDAFLLPPTLAAE